MSLFTDHPQSVGETYGQHLKFAVRLGVTLIGAGLAAIIHGIFPFLCQRTASQVIRKLYEKTCTRGVPANTENRQEPAA